MITIYYFGLSPHKRSTQRVIQELRKPILFLYQNWQSIQKTALQGHIRLLLVHYVPSATFKNQPASAPGTPPCFLPNSPFPPHFPSFEKIFLYFFRLLDYKLLFYIKRLQNKILNYFNNRRQYTLSTERLHFGPFTGLFKSFIIFTFWRQKVISLCNNQKFYY